MNDSPRHTLLRIIAEHGPGICQTPKRVEALLRDLCGAHRREINILIGALEERVAADLIPAAKSIPRDVLLARLEARLRDHLAFTPEAARWGVETWALALGVLSDAELRVREETKAAEDAAPSIAPPPARTAKPAADNPPRVNPPIPRTSPPPTPASAAPQRSSPRMSQPFIFPTGPRLTPAASTGVTSPPPPLPPEDVPLISSRQRSPRRGLTFRGCLIGIVVLIVVIVAAVFVVPAVILILQEEQATPSINEPRIR